MTLRLVTPQPLSISYGHKQATQAIPSKHTHTHTHTYFNSVLAVNSTVEHTRTVQSNVIAATRTLQLKG